MPNKVIFLASCVTLITCHNNETQPSSGVLPGPGRGRHSRRKRQRDGRACREDGDSASCSPTPQPLRSFPHAPAGSHFVIAAPQSSAQTPQEGRSCWGCVAGGSLCQLQGWERCFRIINIPSLGQRDVPSPEPLMLAKDSWGKAGQQEQVGPILDPPAAHFSLCKPPVGLQSCHSSSHMPQGAATAHIPACTGRGGSTAPSETFSHPSQAAVKAQEGSHCCNLLPVPITVSALSVPPPAQAVFSSP